MRKRSPKRILAGQPFVHHDTKRVLIARRDQFAQNLFGGHVTCRTDEGSLPSNRELCSLIAKWETVIGAQVAGWGVKQMMTRWGTCNIEARRIWLNLELIKKPVHCLEYIVVHEMVHLLERHHNERFVG